MSAGFLNPLGGLGSNMPEDPAGELVARQRLAKLLAGQKSYSDSSPKQHPLQVLAQVADGAMAGIDAKQQLALTLAATQAGNADFAKVMSAPGASTTPSTTTPTPRPSPAAAATPGAQIPGSLSLDENNIDLATRTAMAEAGSMGAPGMRDVAAVLRNRALLSGKSVADEALAKNQFEPWNPGSKNDPRRFKVDSPEYQAARAAIEPVLLGTEPDPTGGATHFYAPKAQAAIGRSAPKWDDGTGEDRGLHRFFRHPWAGKNPADLAKAAAAAPVAQAASDTQAAVGPQASAEPAQGDDLRSQIQAAFDAKRTGQGGPDAAFTSFLTGPKDPNGGFYVPPEIRATAPPGDPSGPRLGDEPVDPLAGPGDPSDLRGQITQAMTAQKQREKSDLKSSFSPDGMGAPAGGLEPPSAPPALAPMNVPQPPARPDDAALQEAAREASPAPAAPLPAPQPRVRSQIASTLAGQPSAAAAPAAPQRQGIDAVMGGLQDGLDRVFGGPETQARLNAQQSIRSRIAEAVADRPAPRPALQAPKPNAYSSLPAGGAAPVPAAAQAQAPQAPTPQVAPSDAPQPQPPVQVAQAARPAAAPTATDAQPPQSDRARMAMQYILKYGSNDAFKTQVDLAKDIYKQETQRYTNSERDGRVISTGPNGQSSVVYDKSKDDQDRYGTFTDSATGVTYQYKKGSDEAPKPLSPGGERGAKVTDLVSLEERAAAGIPADYKGVVQRNANGAITFPSTGGVTVTNNLGPKANEALDGTIIKKIEESQSKAEGAIGTIKAINRQKAALDNGLVSGWGANWQTQARAAAAKLLGLPDDALTSSEIFDAASTQKSAELAKAISQAGHTTNMDLQLGKTIAGGNRETTERAIRAIVEAQERLALDTIEEHNRKVDKFGKINPAVADRAAWFKMEAPEVYQYGAAKAGAQGGAPTAATATPTPRDGGSPPPVMTPGQSKTINGIQIRRVN